MIKNLKIGQIVSLLLMGISWYFFAYFQELVVLEMVLGILALLALYLNYYKKQSTPLGFLFIFLLVFSLFAAYDINTVNLWQIILIFSLFGFGFNYQQLVMIKDTRGAIYAALLSVVIMEIFIALIPWPTDALNRSFLLLVIYYFFWELLISHLGGSLIRKKVIYLSIFIILIFIAIISTLSWLGY